MVQRTKPATSNDERYRHDIDREFDKFIARERELMAEERKERADRLGLALLVYRKETAS
jgi:hypothetical protein